MSQRTTATTSTTVRPDDSDLEDLLGHSNGAPAVPPSNQPVTSPPRESSTSDEDEEKAPLMAVAASASSASTTTISIPSSTSRTRDEGREDPAAERKRFLQQQRTSATGFSYYPQKASCVEYCTAYLSLICHYHPWFCSALAASAGLFLLFALVNAVLNPMQTYGVLPHDHSNIRSKYDLTMGLIDHWCLGGGNEDCLCEDPLTPTSQMNRKAWVKALRANRDIVAEYKDPLRQKDVDVAFVGESLVEQMSGRWLGRTIGPLSLMKQSFNTHFKKDKGARFEGVALGIAGDTSPNVLYRLMHGEMPDHFQPRVWWLVLGMNDLSRMKCSEEVTVLGILRVVEEILEHRPDSRVVINSLLPMEYSRGGQYALMHDYQDSMGEMGNRASDRIKDEPVSAGAVNDEKEGWRRVLRVRERQVEQEEGPGFLAEETQLETKTRKREGKRQRGHNNAVLETETHHARKYNLVSGLLNKRKKTPPLWTAIYAINKELKAFADKNDNVDFFDSTPIFTSKLSGGKYELKSSLISARGHPTLDGFRVWEDSMMVRLDSVLNKMKQDSPDLFPELERVTDDSAGLPRNVTAHPGYGFDGPAPDVQMPVYNDDNYAEEGKDHGDDDDGDDDIQKPVPDGDRDAPQHPETHEQGQEPEENGADRKDTDGADGEPHNGEPLVDGEDIGADRKDNDGEDGEPHHGEPRVDGEALQQQNSGDGESQQNQADEAGEHQQQEPVAQHDEAPGKGETQHQTEVEDEQQPEADSTTGEGGLPSGEGGEQQPDQSPGDNNESPPEGGEIP